MNWLKKYGIFLFLMLLLFHCSAIYFEWIDMRFYSKLLIIPFLMVLMGVNMWGGAGLGSFKMLPFIAMLASFTGDLLLGFSDAQFFLWGMLSFMVTHICNSIYFLKLNPLRFKKSKPVFVTFLILAFFSSLVIYTIRDNLGAYLIPIMVYMVIIGVMACLASNLLSDVAYTDLALQYFIPGAGLFVMSDGILALNKFSLQEPLLDLFVMLTYGLAQLYLAMGFYKTYEYKIMHVVK